MLNYFRLSTCLIGIAIALLVSGCTPKYDWREVRGTEVPFVVLLPAKPASISRLINLDGEQVTMTMTAAKVDGVMFAVGTAALPTADKAQAALHSMKTALVHNIGGTITSEKSSVDKTTQRTMLDIEATAQKSANQPANNDGQALRLIAHFVAKDRQVYQVVIIGPDKVVTRDAIDTFFTSFKIN